MTSSTKNLPRGRGTIGKQIVRGLTQFADDLKAGKDPEVTTVRVTTEKRRLSEALRERRGAAKVAAPIKGAALAGRQRVTEPDPSTPEGQWALYLTHLLQDHKTSEFAKAIGKSRSMVFKWLTGENIPPLPVWNTIAAYLGLHDWRDLVPPDEFVKSIGQPIKRRKR